MSEPLHKVGDWLCFQASGVLRIGEVRFILRRSFAPYEIEYITDIGMVGEKDVLEKRERR